MSASPKIARRPRTVEEKSLNVSIISGVASIAIALIYGGWGIHLSNKQIELAQKQSEADVKVAEFGKLLKTTDDLLSRQTSALKELSEQLETQRELLSLSQQQFASTTKNEQRNRKQNVEELFSSANSVLIDINQKKRNLNINDLDQRSYFMSSLLDEIRAKIIANPILIDNDTLYHHVINSCMIMDVYKETGAIQRMIMDDGKGHKRDGTYEELESSKISEFKYTLDDVERSLGQVCLFALKEKMSYASNKAKK